MKVLGPHLAKWSVTLEAQRLWKLPFRGNRRGWISCWWWPMSSTSSARALNLWSGFPSNLTSRCWISGHLQAFSLLLQHQSVPVEEVRFFPLFKKKKETISLPTGLPGHELGTKTKPWGQDGVLHAWPDAEPFLFVPAVFVVSTACVLRACCVWLLWWDVLKCYVEFICVCFEWNKYGAKSVKYCRHTILAKQYQVLINDICGIQHAHWSWWFWNQTHVGWVQTSSGFVPVVVCPQDAFGHRSHGFPRT